MKIAVFPGSFDPITVGHEAIIRRAIPLFDKIVLAIGINSNKNYMFSLDDRKEALNSCFASESKIEVQDYKGLTIDFCESINAAYILRGLRVAVDFEYERNIALMNREMNANIETVFLISEPKFSAVSSTVVRDIIKNNGDVSQFVPHTVKFK